MSEFPKSLRRPLIPNGCRRAPWHDYRSRSIYMITISLAKGIPALSVLKGIPGDHDWPPTAQTTELGNIIAHNLSGLKSAFPFVKILRRVIMPDHIHFVIFVEKATDIHLGSIINHLKRRCSLQYCDLISGNHQRPANAFVSIFEDGYHDRILMKKNQLQKLLNYVSDNPRRRLLRLKNPGFHRRGRIKLPGNREFDIYGNVDLLSDPDIEAVKISSKYSFEELRSRKLCWKRTVENCGVLISPFISRDEKRVYDWAVENGGRIIYIITGGIGERFTPKGIHHRLCDEGRLLLIGSTSPSFAKYEISRIRCNEMNGLALDISNGKFSIIH